MRLLFPFHVSHSGRTEMRYGLPRAQCVLDRVVRAAAPSSAHLRCAEPYASRCRASSRDRLEQTLHLAADVEHGGR